MKHLRHYKNSTPIYILLCILLMACTREETNLSRSDQLIALDDSLFFLPRQYDIQDIQMKFDSIDLLCVRQGDNSNRVMLRHIMSDLYIQNGHYALAFNEARKLLDLAENEYDNSIYFLTLSNIDTELNLFDKAHDRLHDATNGLKRNRILLTRIYLHELELDIIRKNFEQALLKIDKIERLNAADGKKDLPLNIQIRYHAWQTLFYLYTGTKEKSKQLIDAYDSNQQFRYSYGYEAIRHLLKRNYYTTIQDYPQANYHAQAYINECQKLKNRQWEVNGYERAGRISEASGEKAKAIQYFRKALALQDSLATISFNRQQVLLKKELQTDELNFKLWQSRQELLQNALKYGIVALCIITLGTVFLIYANRKLKRSTKQLAMAKKRAEESIQAKSLFLSNMSHEIRTPLNAISGFSEILISQPDMDKEMRSECNKIIRENSMLLLKLLDDVLDLSNLDIEKMNFSFKEADVIAVGRSIINMLQSIKHTSNAAIRFQTTLDELILYTDENRLRQLLINLLVNATKFTKEGSITLEISIDKEHSNAIFSVTDTGCGIPLEKQEKVFSRFEKLHEQVSGTGLGLSICQSIIQRLGGNIWIDAAYTTGARFVFSHPIPQTHDI